MNGYWLSVMAKSELRHALGQRKVWFLTVFLALPMGLTYLMLYYAVEFDHPLKGALYLYLLYPQTICVLAAALYGTSLIQEEIHGKTLTYLLTRPVPRWVVLVGKYAGMVAALFMLTTISWTICWLPVYPTGGLKFFGAFALVNLLALATYTAIFALFGLLFPRHALFLSIAYGVVVEFVLSLIPAVINKICVSYYIRSILTTSLSLEIDDPDLALVVGDLPVGWAIAALVSSSLLLVAVCSFLLTCREYHITEQV